MHSFEYYKDNVPIVQVAEALGYELNKKAGRNPLEYKHPDHNTIVIGNLKGRQRYFTRHETDNRGSVIDFVKHRLGLFNVYYDKEVEGINKVLASFAGVPFSSSNKKLWLHERKPFDMEDFNISKPELKDLLYLSGKRGLDEKTLQAFLPHILLVKAHHKPTTDIGFPYRLSRNGQDGKTSQDEIVGFELVNYLFKGHARGSNKSEGLWATNLSGTGFPPNVFVAESAIDAMSFYQLYRHKYDLDRAAFLSSGGYVTDRQIRNLLKMYPHATIHTLFDNDLSGHLYDIRLACMQENKNLRVRKEADQLYFELDKRSFVLPQHQTSLTNFRKASGVRPDIKVHKANGKDFNEMLLRRNLSTAKNPLKR